METNLAEAIETLRSLSVSAAEPKTLDIECDDGKGGKLPLKVLVNPVEGPKGLLEIVKAGTEYARAERLRNAPGPDQRAGTAHHQELDSFVEHVNRFKAKNSAVWANAAKRELVSVLDYHDEGATSPAKWGKHRGVYACPLSEAWKAWGGGHRIDQRCE